MNISYWSKKGIKIRRQKNVMEFKHFWLFISLNFCWIFQLWWGILLTSLMPLTMRWSEKGRYVHELTHLTKLSWLKISHAIAYIIFVYPRSNSIRLQNIQSNAKTSLKSRVCYFGRIQKQICDLRSFRSWCIEETNKSTLDKDSSVPLMHYMIQMIWDHKSVFGFSQKNA